MGLQVVMGATLKCSYGAAPGSMVVATDNAVNAEMMPAATVKDHAPTKNIAPFGMCNSTSNPQVISATAAAQGTHTPQPCIPVTTDPWSPGASTTTIKSNAALDDASTLKCKWNGVIEVQKAGQATVTVN